jgi:hypothetical protein
VDEKFKLHSVENTLNTRLVNCLVMGRGGKLDFEIFERKNRYKISKENSKPPKTLKSQKRKFSKIPATPTPKKDKKTKKIVIS